MRAELKRALEELGYVVYTSETPDFPVDTSLPPVDNCLAVVKDCDIYVLIIHTRYGGRFDGNSRIPSLPDSLPGGYLSVTMAEFLTAKASGLETRIWVRDCIWESRPVFRALSPSEHAAVLPDGVEPAVYDFLDYLQASPQTFRCWINAFHSVVDLKESVAAWLRGADYVNEEQFKREVAEVFQLHGYRLNQAELLRPGSNRAFAEYPTDSFGARYAVHTYYQPTNRTVRWSDIEGACLRIQSELAAGEYDRAFLIVSTEYHAEVETRLKRLPQRRCLRVESYAELLSALIDFRPYLERIVYDYEHYG